MKKIICYLLVLSLILLFAQQSLMAQVITLQPSTHLGIGDKVIVNAVTTLDTTTSISDPITCIFVFNDKSDSKTYTLGLNRKGTEFDNIKLYTSTKVNAGFHTIFIKFSDTSIKAYSALVSAHLKTPGTANIIERLKYRTKVQDVDAVFTKLKTQIEGLGPAFLPTIPKGLKCMVAIDFFGPEGFEQAGDTVYCSTTSFEIVPATNDRTADLFVRNLIGGDPDSPLYILLSAGWQMRADQFDGNAAELKKEVFGHDKYEVLKSSDPVIDAHFTVTTNKVDSNFRRLIFYIDN